MKKNKFRKENLRLLNAILFVIKATIVYSDYRQ